MLVNKMSENGKPDKIPDNLTRTLTLTGSGSFMSLFTHTRALNYRRVLVRGIYFLAVIFAATVVKSTHNCPGIFSPQTF